MGTIAMTSQPITDALAEGRRIIEEARRAGLEVFLLGGVAIRMRIPQLAAPLFVREFNDIDIITSRSAGKAIAKLLHELGYRGDRDFNAVNGRTRMLFRDESNGRDLDVLIGEFEMCHVLPVLEEATLEQETIPLADLLLTKLQIVEMNRKDVLDIYNLLHACEVCAEGGDQTAIDAERIARLCAQDWGLWRTVSRNLERLLVPPYRPEIDPAEAELVAARVACLAEAIDTAKKSRRWHLRNRVGERVRWYEEPEEAH